MTKNKSRVKRGLLCGLLAVIMLLAGFCILPTQTSKASALNNVSVNAYAASADRPYVFTKVNGSINVSLSPNVVPDTVNGFCFLLNDGTHCDYEIESSTVKYYLARPQSTRILLTNEQVNRMKSGGMPLADIYSFAEYGMYYFGASATYRCANTTVTQEFNASTPFLHSATTSDDSNYVDITIGKYTTPVITALNGNININGGASFGDTYTVNVGDYSANTAVASMTLPTTTTAIPLDTPELLAGLTRGTAYDMWVVSNGKNLFKSSDKSTALRFTAYDDIPVSFEDNNITWSAVNGVSTYNVNLICDGTLITKTVTGNSIAFSEWDILNGLCYVTVEVKSDTLTLSKSNSIVVKVSQLIAPVIRVEGENLMWDAVAGANGYRVFYNETFTDVTEPTINLMGLNLDLGNYNLKVRAIGNMTAKDKLSLKTVSTFLTQMVAVNYNVDGDITSKLVEYGSMLTLPLIEKAGKVFEGWYYDKDFTKQVAVGDKVASSITVYAKLTDEAKVEPQPKAPIGFWANVWNTIKPFVIWGGIGLGVVLVIAIVVKIVKKIRG